MAYAECLLWKELRKAKLGVRFKAQHPIDKVIADFYCHKEKLVIEIDGNIHHFQKEYDIGRTHELERFGIKVIRFTNKDVENKLLEILNLIRIEVQKRVV
jgi:very-short-patch-repair endonuclease